MDLRRRPTLAWLAAFGGPRRRPVTLVNPVLVVDVIADTAHEYGHWRHMVKLARLRPDLAPAEIRPVPL